MAAGVVQIPWYATLFRGDKLEAALRADRAARAALRRDRLPRLPQPRRPVQVHADAPRSRTSSTSSATGTARSSATGARDYSSWYQVPILYTWNDLVFQGGLEPAAANGGTV